MIPGYRLRFYCFIVAVICLGGSLLAAQGLSDAVTLGQFDTLTGPRLHRIKEHLVFNDQPWRFGWHLLIDSLYCVGSTLLGALMTWIVLRGRRAFKRWPQGF